MLGIFKDDILSCHLYMSLLSRTLQQNPVRNADIDSESILSLPPLKGCNLPSWRKEASEIDFITMFAAAPNREYSQFSERFTLSKLKQQVGHKSTPLNQMLARGNNLKMHNESSEGIK